MSTEKTVQITENLNINLDIAAKEHYYNENMEEEEYVLKGQKREKFTG